MGDSLRDQLLKSGIVKKTSPTRDREAPRPLAAPVARKFRDKRPPRGDLKASAACAREREEIDLAKAYAIRARSDAAERQQADKQAADEARLRRERKQQIQQLLQGKALNLPEADHARHFDYAGKIRRVHVDAAQLASLNAGELGVVQNGGRYLLVSRALAEKINAIDASRVALLPDPSAGGSVADDGVPDDLIW